MPSSSGSDVAGCSFFFFARSFSSRNACLSTCSPSRNSVSPGSMHAHLLQHLAHDHADVLVVDLDALEAIDLLHLVEQILLHRARALDPQDVVRIHRSLGQPVTGPDAVAFVHAEVLPGRAPRTAGLPACRRRLASAPSRCVGCTKISRLPRLISPNRTTPSISEMVAGSFGRRASNSSATRGRPPVMSRVLYASRFTLEMMVPAETRAPFPPSAARRPE